ncbi:F-box domain-containing protein [Mycena sanguinolenta]|uniref:F-box domain-containing protein n=1 Tax=Mycena sanguinolenta TaxID=230812 RepID=A0A8H6XTD9_9AGAR|nr:F-box domain-containing protein [Mycena sanguinolenta]
MGFRTDFQDLPEDVIRSVFSFCDIYAVVSMSRTNKYLRRLSLDKLVWTDLVANLWRRGFIDQASLSDIQSSSLDSLLALVKGLLTGPSSWNGNANLKPKSRWFLSPKSRRVQNPIPVDMHTKYIVHPREIVASNLNQPKLLNGGEYVLFNNATLECWSIHRDELVWAYEKSGPEFSVVEFAAEVIDGGDSVNIVVCERSWTLSGTGSEQSLVQVLKLDLYTGSSTQLLLNRNPYGNVWNFTDAKISGDIASVVVESWKNVVGTTPYSHCILMNWKGKTELRLASNTAGSPFLITLIPYHVIWVSASISGGPEISVIQVSTALSSHWNHVGKRAYSPTPGAVFTPEVETVAHESITSSECAYLKE